MVCVELGGNSELGRFYCLSGKPEADGSFQTGRLGGRERRQAVLRERGARTPYRGLRRADTDLRGAPSARAPRNRVSNILGEAGLFLAESGSPSLPELAGFRNDRRPGSG